MARKAQRQIRKFVNWKTGAAALALLVVILGVGQIFGVWATLWQGLFGTAGPAGGYSCLPTCNDGARDYNGDGQPDPQDGKFLALVGEQLASFAGEPVVAWISVPAGNTSFEIGFFDGDSGKDSNGVVRNAITHGHWDDTITEGTYTLYRDPLKDGSGRTVVGQWHGNQDPMPDNDWYNVTLDTDQQALDPAGDYYVYRLVGSRPIQGIGVNAFKLRSTGYVTAGQSGLVNASLPLIGMLGTRNDTQILYPQFAGDYNNLGPSLYDGDWQFYFNVPDYQTRTLELWDGDFDRGSYDYTASDTDDPNTVGKPAWASSFAVDERAGGRGAPRDDNQWPQYRVSPGVWYEIIDPAGVPIYKNGEPGNPNEPSGTEEWEHFVISTDPAKNPDLFTDKLLAGDYTWHIVGLDLHNVVWIRTNVEVCKPGDCVTPPPRTCPRTIGYWKNNVYKIFIKNTNKGIQETRDSILRALDLIALDSPLYRSGINLADPAPIPAPADGNPPALTPNEADDILQKINGNTMLDRALQQNLAAWLNLMSGKLNKTTTISLNWGSGSFEGTVWEALQEAQDIILSATDPEAPELERAKSMADQINNGLLGENADASTCSDYTQVMPPDKQPPDNAHKPKGPKPEPQQPAPVTCANARSNQYGVETTTDNPFPGIKFNYQSGTEIKDGLYDQFQVVLTADAAASLQSVQMEAKAGENVGQVMLQGCAWDALAPCETVVQDPSGFFEFSFGGARPNDDGSLTLVFQVKNLTSYGLSHVAIGVPATPSGGSYQSQVCQ